MPSVLARWSRAAAFRPGTGSAPAGPVTTSKHHSVSRQSGRMIASSVCVLCMSGAFFPAYGDAAVSTGTQAAEPDHEIAMMLSKVERQVVAGQATTPPHDNAMETWQQITEKMVAPVSPRVVQALADFATQMRGRAAAEETAGNPLTSVGLSFFADLASDEVKSVDAPAATPLPRAAQADPDHAPKGDPLPAQSAPATGARATPPSVPSSSSRVPDASAAPPSAPSSTSIVPGPTQAVVPPPAAVALVAARPLPETARPPADGPTTAAPVVGRPTPDQPPHNHPVLNPAVVAEPPAAGAGGAIEGQVATAYVDRGDALLAIKDVSGARKFYEFGANIGSARAATALARTYDPYFLASLGVIGLQPDMAVAVKWYNKAAALGDRDAIARLRFLQQASAK
jgi:hypothetical protein